MATKNTELFRITFPVPETVTGMKEVVVALDNNAISVTRRAQDALTVARSIAPNLEAVNMGDLLAIVVLANNAHLTGPEAVNEAKILYQEWAQQAKRDAYMLGLTMQTDFGTREPKPYEDDTEENDPAIPKWAQISTPRPKHNLKNPLERRLKLLIDVLNEGGGVFSAEVKNGIDTAIAEMFKRFGIDGGVPKDSDGFQPGGVNAAVSDVTGASDPDGNN